VQCSWELPRRSNYGPTWMVGISSLSSEEIGNGWCTIWSWNQIAFWMYLANNYLWTHSNGISLIFHPRELVICLSWNILVLWMVVVFCYLNWCNEITIGLGEGEQGYLESCIWNLFFCCGPWFYVEECAKFLTLHNTTNIIGWHQCFIKEFFYVA
jgi:hypothetical protein